MSQIKRYNPTTLFPTYVFHSEILDQKLLYEWKQESIKLIPDDARIKSYRGNRPWCTDDNLFDLPQFSKIVDWIILETNYGLDQLNIKRDSHYVSSLWLNAQYQNNNHSVHTHSNSILSGVVYIDIPQNSQSLVFHDPRPQSQVLVPNSTSDNNDLACNPAIDPTPGSMYFWPSWLPHSTFSDTFVELERPRLTFAFNIMIKSICSNHSSRFIFS